MLIVNLKDSQDIEIEEEDLSNIPSLPKL